MNKIYETIWNLALEHQDAREDEGHAAITRGYAFRLLKEEDANPDVVIPAITLHDIGWSFMPEEERFVIFNLRAKKKEKIKMRIKHQTLGSRKAEEFLIKVGYDSKLSKHIIKIISKHDTREGTFSKEDSVVRDADKLWRFSNKGFWADLRRSHILPLKLYNKLKNNIDKENFFLTETAKRIAREELEQRRKEF